MMIIMMHVVIRITMLNYYSVVIRILLIVFRITSKISIHMLLYKRKHIIRVIEIVVNITYAHTKKLAVLFLSVVYIIVIRITCYSN